MNDDLVRGLLAVWTANVVALVVSLADAHTWMQMLSLALAMAYTIWKWRRDAKRKAPRRQHLLKCAVLFPLIVSQGCSLVPSERQKRTDDKRDDARQQQTALTIRKAVTGQQTPTPAIAVTGTSNVVSVAVASPQMPPSRFPVTNLPARSFGLGFAPTPAPSTMPEYSEEVEIQNGTTDTSSAHSTSQVESAVSIPLGVKLALLAGGLMLLVVAVRMIQRHVRGTAIGQAISVADASLKRRIEAWRDRAVASTNPADIAIAERELAALEAERGKLRSNLS
jgi:hypothetical protein